eukprot:8683633-Lingulodinium_polyedra.AAC.1
MLSLTAAYRARAREASLELITGAGLAKPASPGVVDCGAMPGPGALAGGPRSGAYVLNLRSGVWHVAASAGGAVSGSETW